MKQLISGGAALVAVFLMVVPVEARVVGAAASTSMTSAVTTITCGPKSSTQYPAPGVGLGATFGADSTGSVKLLQPTLTTLDVENVTPISGWKGTVVTETGTRVHVGFQQVGAPEEQVRFWARLSSTGTVITIVTQTCT